MRLPVQTQSICSVKRDRLLRGAYGGARPIRSDVEIPEDAPVLGDEWYENTTSPESAELQEACDEIARLWEEEVIPLLG